MLKTPIQLFYAFVVIPALIIRVPSVGEKDVIRERGPYIIFLLFSHPEMSLHNRLGTLAVVDPSFRSWGHGSLHVAKPLDQLLDAVVELGPILTEVYVKH